MPHRPLIAINIFPPVGVVFNAVELVYINVNNFRQERDMGMGLVPFYSSWKQLKVYRPNIKGHGMAEVPETSAEVCDDRFRAMRLVPFCSTL